MKIQNIIIGLLLIICSINNVLAEFGDTSLINNRLWVTKPITIIHLTDDTVVGMYTDTLREDYIVGGNIINNSIVWGSRVFINSNPAGYNYYSLSKINDTMFILVYGKPAYNSDVIVRIGSNINNVITMHSSILIESHTRWNNMINIDVLNNYCIVSYAIENGNTKVIIGEIDNTNVVFGTPSIIDSGYSSSMDVKFINDSYFIVHYRSSTGIGHSRLGNYNGIVINSLTIPYIFSTNIISAIDSCVLTSNKVIVSYLESGIKCIIGNIISGAIVYNTEYLVSSSGGYPSIDNYNETCVRLLYAENKNLTSIIGNINNNIITYTDQIVISINPAYIVVESDIDIISNTKYISIYGQAESVHHQGYGYSIVWDNTPIIIINSNTTSTNHTETFDDLFSDLSVWGFLIVIFATFENECGNDLFWLIIIMIPFTMTWIKQKSVIIPSILALLCGGTLFTLLPESAIAPIKILLTIGIAGIFYHIIKSR